MAAHTHCQDSAAPIFRDRRHFCGARRCATALFGHRERVRLRLHELYLRKRHQSTMLVI